VGGFNESLETAEDLEFFTRAANTKQKITLCEEAVVFWKLPTWTQYFSKIFAYARGDAQSRIWWDRRKKLQTHNIKLMLAIGRYGVLGALFFFGFRVLAFAFWVVYLIAVAERAKIDFTKFAKRSGVLILGNIASYVIIKTLTDLAAICGFIAGLLRVCFGSQKYLTSKTV
jgi:hypothetical protein